MKVLRIALSSLVVLALAGIVLAAAPKPQAAAPKAAPATPTPAASAPTTTPATGPSSSQTLDRVAAVVNDEVVLESEVWDQVQQVLARATTRPDSSEIDTLRQQVLENLINIKLVYAEAKKAGVTLSDTELDRYVDQAIDGKRQELGGEEAFNESLRRENLSLDRLRQQYREQVRTELISERFRDRQVPHPRVTATEAEAFFKEHPERFPKKSPEYRLAVIQLPVTADSVADAVGRAAALAARKRIVAGEKFAKVTAELSDDTGTAHSGGDLGFFTRGTTVPEFEQVAFSLKVGVVSEPVRTPFGWHLIEVLERDTLKTRTHRDSLDAQGQPLQEAHVRHLLIRVEPTQADADRYERMIHDIRDRAERGEDFGALAKRYSRYAGPQSEGGEIGWVSLESLSPTIRAALDSLRAGQISDVVPSPGQPTGVSFNLFKVLELKPERDFTLDEVREQLPDVVGRIRYSDKIDEWLKGLRARATIEIKKL